MTGKMNVDIQKVEKGDEYFHIRFNEPEMFDKIRTPDWADTLSDSVSEGSEVRMGQMKDSDDWTVQAFLIKKTVGENKAKQKAKKIVEKIES